jgi:carboxyl-terminal processing protease
MEETKGQRIYKIIMLIIITALLSSLITTIFIKETIISSSSLESIRENGGTTGIEGALATIRTMIEDEYIGEIDDEQMLEMAIKGYVAGVGDEYTEYYTPEEMQEQLETAVGNYVGIGIYMVVNYEDGIITVLEPMEGSPAESAGLKEGDIINKVEGTEVTKDNVEEMSDAIKGEEGTKVKLEIKREDETFDVEVERKKIEVSHIDSRMLESNIGYIQIADFDGGAAKEFRENYEKLKSEGATSLIIDIRNNGGGVVDESIDILEMICDKGSTLLIEKDKDGNETITTAEEDPIINMPIVVLTNEYSASASEILAGALKDNGKATIIGEKTYGKGVIQTLYSLSDGSGLKITTAEYCTPNRNSINKIGIEPDIEVKLPENTKEITDKNDTQLKKAIEELK